MHILLVEPDYYTRYPPLGLLKLSSYFKKKGHTTELIRGRKIPKHKPDKIYVTSLFTFAWEPVHDAVKYYKKKYPDATITLGGIYASLMPKHAKTSGANRIHKGLHEGAEKCIPDYSLIPEWDGSIIFSSRGCVRKCPFCAVPRLEGSPNHLKYSIKDQIYPGHKRIVLWDNNILACPNRDSILNELIELGMPVDFNQGIDGRLITEDIADKLKQIKFKHIRLAYDKIEYRPMIEKAVKILKSRGISGRRVIVYTLYNFEDTPDDFWKRVKDLLEWGVCSYPMKFQKLENIEKNSYIAPGWTHKDIEMVESARRVIGFAGVFPPYKKLVSKISQANDFHQAFALRAKHEREEDDIRKRHLKCNGPLDWKSSLNISTTD